MTDDKSVIDFPMDGAPSEGCSTTTNLAQLSIESDAGAGAVHIITLLKIGRGFGGICSYNHAATTSRHVCKADALKARCVLAEVRRRWTLKILP